MRACVHVRACVCVCVCVCVLERKRERENEKVHVSRKKGASVSGKRDGSGMCERRGYKTGRQSEQAREWVIE